MHQIGFELTKSRIIEFITRSVSFATLFIKAFNVRFQPNLLKRDRLFKQYSKQIQQLCLHVNTSDDERIIAMFMNCLNATVRTNMNQVNRQALALKFDAGLVPGIEQPKPKYHAFVYSEKVMGIHIRFSSVSRGGIRCSDRVDDFYQEILSLASTQRLKNTLTIPDGGKGGFVCRHLDMIDYDARSEEIVSCYHIFISSLLDLVDDIKGQVKRHS